MEYSISRRQFVTTSLATAACGAGRWVSGQTPANSVNVRNPRGRVPLSFIIDDSTCLVNMGHFCMPQFAEAWPERKIYQQPWREWPREIPDAFVREFGEWCAEHGVKGKYSVVPNPACVGWLDRGLPGWSRAELKQSLKLVRELMVPNWDIHPEMITHTRIIDLKTGRPVEGANSATMENSYPQEDVSVDYLASYLALALQVLKNCELPCEGITTPGGFGNRVKDKLPLAVHQAVRDVYGTELPHYFKYIATGSESTRAQLEYTTPAASVDDLTMNVLAGTGDWFGGWEGSRESEGFRYANEDASSGRMVELIERGEPAVMICHWPGMYCNGTKAGFADFKRVVQSIGSRFGETTIWMKVSEIGRYEAARQRTRFQQVTSHRWSIDAPFDCRNFTFDFAVQDATKLRWQHGVDQVGMQAVNTLTKLQEGTFYWEDGRCTVCVRLPRGESQLLLDV